MGVKARSDGLKPKQSPSQQTSSSSSQREDISESREDRIVAELVKINEMKATEMKKELQDLGISTSSFFEKSEFAKALAEARVDGVAKKEEEVEVDVEVLPKSDPGPKKRSSEQSQQQARGSPFGGGGMGGMGGLEDLMKGMGGPFGG